VRVSPSTRGSPQVRRIVTWFFLGARIFEHVANTTLEAFPAIGATIIALWPDRETVVDVTRCTFKMPPAAA